MAVDSSAIVARIRLFHDDLQLGLMKFGQLPRLELKADSAGNALFARYLAERVWVEADGKRLAGTVQASGVETDTQGQPIIWYLVEYDFPAAPKQLGVRNDLLFETFPSQQNVVNVLDVASSQRFSFYFVPGSTKVQQATLR